VLHGQWMITIPSSADRTLARTPEHDDCPQPHLPHIHRSTNLNVPGTRIFFTQEEAGRYASLLVVRTIPSQMAILRTSITFLASIDD